MNSEGIKLKKQSRKLSFLLINLTPLRSLAGIFLFSLFFSFPLFSQNWISHPTAKPDAYGVFHFRKVIGFQRKPETFIIHISADPRFRFFVNGKSVAVGPARSDVEHWKYQTLDIAPFLQTGKNVLAAVVYNDGEHAAWGQMSAGTGFFLRGNTEAEAIANTDNSWKVIENQAYSPLATINSWKVIENQAYSPLATINHITGSGEQIFGQRYPWGWETLDFDDHKWLVAKREEFGGGSRGQLTTGNNQSGNTNVLFPQPEEKLQRISVIRKISGLPESENLSAFLKGKDTQIPIGEEVTILLDQTFLTNAYPCLLVSGGRGAKITITYAEALFAQNGKKSNRNEIEGKEIKGNQDIFLPDGGEKRLFQANAYRTFRYIELHIENHKEPLTLHDFHSIFTAYPFEEKAGFKADDETLSKIWQVGWRTARLCAFETYMDCPYYEQLQYIGDTRIQALISLYVSGDERLMKNAILQFQQSMISQGLTQSRYPSHVKQIIPPFSLLWIAMIHDFWMHRTDDDFVKSMLPDVKKILDWHKKYINAKGILGKMPYWNFVDWTREWTWTGTEETSGIPAGTLTGNSSILTLQYMMALQKAIDLYNYYEKKTEAFGFLQTANALKSSVYEKCWDAEKKYFSDTPEKVQFSQHIQALAILTGTIPETEQKSLITRTLADTQLIQCSFYYRFYLLQALKKAGLADEYLNQLSPWKKMLDLGLTTFAETPDPTRSDCHAWSASPNYEFLATVCGIIPSSPGFRTVKIEPHLGNLTSVEAKMPHPKGEISVKYKVKNGKILAEIFLPKGVTGEFVREGKIYKLGSGSNRF